MTYDNRQALTVALYNAGQRGTRGPNSFPFELADAVLANLHSMGWVLDGYVHQHGVAMMQKREQDQIASTCGEPACDQPSVDWGLCSGHLKEAADAGVFDPPRHRDSDWKGDQ